MNASQLAQRRLGRYELIAEIASGGMGIVCLARAVGAGGFRRLFAIKVLHPHLLQDQQFVTMLLDEAQLAARIHHPNVVATIDVCASDDFNFLVMDYVDGFPLCDVLDHEAITPEQRHRLGNRILLDAMAGLDAAHSLENDEGESIGFVHRDVSPQNILIGVDGVGRLTDFGIALAASRISASRPGTVKGKPSYMAPEQTRGQPLDRRADIWALGVILWEVLVGRRLFVAQTEMATIHQVVAMPIPSPLSENPGLPPGLVPVCLRALQRDPARRYASVREMSVELERAASSAGLLASSQEVTDLLRALFTQQIERRRANLRAFTEELPQSSALMKLRDIYELPRLDETPVVATPTPQVPEPPRSSLRRKTKVAPRKPVELDSIDIEPVATPALRRRPGKKLGLIAVLSSILGGALGLWITRSLTPHTASTAAPAHSSGLLEPRELPQATSEVLPPAASALDGGSPVTTAKGAKRRTRAVPKPAPAKRAPVFEENPYGLR